jgi:NADPH-dependent 2,4-dienoyl-CoA reductase/sulfur reductase-like enzyme
MEAIPRRLLVLGGGPAGVELAQAVRRLGGEVSRTATYTHADAESGGFLTLLSDGERLTGAYALGPPRPASGCSRPRWPSGPAFRSGCCTTRSSSSRASPRSTPPR